MRNVSGFRRAIARIREEPGTTNVRRFDSLVSRALSERSELREWAFADLTAELQALRSADWSTDPTLIRYLALASELTRKATDQTPYPVQLLAICCVLREIVIDMATGEGKSLVGTLAAIGFALQGRRVHILTANDYLAARDVAVAAPLYSALGLTFGAVVASTPHSERRQIYRSSIVHSTVQQVGFDELRDRQVVSPHARVSNSRDIALIDEIDAVLIDEALVPLVLAGESAKADMNAVNLASVVAGLEVDRDYVVDPERRNVAFAEAGVAKVEAALGIDNLFRPENIRLLTSANVALHAEVLVRRDVHYVVKEGRVHIVNEARGRVVDRQRYPDGLQAAIEVKEGIQDSGGAEVLDQALVETIIGGYHTVTGMSGTALEAAQRLAEDYGLRTGSIPPNRPVARHDESDQLFHTVEDRDAAAVRAIVGANAKHQPVLVATHSVAESETFAQALRSDTDIEPVVMNARSDAEEADIIRRAGRAGAVTISTQMAGRGVDILLDESARAAGGLLVIGLGRHESGRIDDQLRGRAGRQGDPGRSIFFTSLEDHVVVHNIQPPPERGGGMSEARQRRRYAHAQRVAEGKLLQLHRKTRSYSQVLEQQRLLTLRVRERYLTGDSELCRLAGRLQLHGLVASEDGAFGAERRLEAFRAITLFHLDDEWRQHLAVMAEIREGIHLRALARQNPLIEYMIAAGSAFENFFDRVECSVASSLLAVDLMGAWAELEAMDMRRPSATWTYMVQDDPFGTPEDRFIRYLGNVVRGGRRGR